LYHLPIQTGAGWSWGARSRSRAFGIGIGIPSYVDEEGWESRTTEEHGVVDVENGTSLVTGNGVGDQREKDGIPNREMAGVEPLMPSSTLEV